MGLDWNTVDSAWRLSLRLAPEPTRARTGVPDDQDRYITAFVSPVSFFSSFSRTKDSRVPRTEHPARVPQHIDRKSAPWSVQDLRVERTTRRKRLRDLISGPQCLTPGRMLSATSPNEPCRSVSETGPESWLMYRRYTGVA